MSSATNEQHPPWPVYSEELKQQRKAQWPVVRDVLRRLPVGEARCNRMLKDFYLKGIVPDRESRSGLECLTLLIFKLWFYPENDIDALRRLWETPDPESFMDHTADQRSTIRTLLYQWPQFGRFPAPYGMMGGREPLLGEIVIPKSYDEQWLKELGNPAILRPKVYVDHFLATARTLLHAETILAFSPFSRGIQYFGETVGRIDIDALVHAKSVQMSAFFNRIREVSSEEIAEYRRSEVMSFVETMREGLDEGRFGAALTELWQRG